MLVSKLYLLSTIFLLLDLEIDLLTLKMTLNNQINFRNSLFLCHLYNIKNIPIKDKAPIELVRKI